MAQWPSVKARKLLRALKRIGWEERRRRGSHRILYRPGWGRFTFAFHDKAEIGGSLLADIAEQTGLTPEDL